MSNETSSLIGNRNHHHSNAEPGSDYTSVVEDRNQEGHRFVVPSTGPLWPSGLALQEREDPADECSCPDAHQCLPCCRLCYGYPLYFATSSTDHALVSTRSLVEYPCCQCPGCRPAWWIKRADVNGVPMRYEAWDCKGDCCGPAIKAFDLSDADDATQKNGGEAEGEGRYIGQVSQRCHWCNCCGEVELARVENANENVVVRRFAAVCCGAVLNTVIDRSCCSCYNSYRWGVKVHDSGDFAGAVTERYHCCSLCHPAQIAYTAEDMGSLSSKLSRDEQKLLPLLLLSMWWRGARVSEQVPEGEKMA